ncbi:hypothetical protein HBI78_185470 [Parastagonospora nodorum]|nr:hypothetical protein HBI78_185470 [Parastagonospora nodorum]
MAADKRTAEYQLMSPFIRLPAELRNCMYEFTFHDTTVKVYERKKHHKQLHMLGPFYAASTFDFTNVRQGLHADTVWWLDSITFFRLCSIDVPLENMMDGVFRSGTMTVTSHTVRSI